MEILHIHGNEKISMEANCMALGYFDGMHLGHLALLESVIKIADKKGLKKALMTFNLHPKEVFDAKEYPHLSTIEDKMEILKSYHFDYLIIIHFDEQFSKLSPTQFIEKYILAYCVQHVVCGFDYRFGYLGKGDVTLLQQASNNQYDVSVIQQQKYHTQKISSTYIKHVLQQGNISLVNRLLQRPYRITGEVIHGYQRGKKELGFATANVAYDSYCIPKLGVYGVKIKIDNKDYFGMASIGYNPTFGDLDKPSLEVHIFDFDMDIYGSVISVLFYMHLRGEIRFSSKEDLITQLYNDQQDIKNYFKL